MTEAQISADPQLPIIWTTRDFAATPAQLIRAHTDPDLFARWTGPGGSSIHIEAWDARRGGSWQFSGTSHGQDHRFYGCFHDITENRIVQTFAWEDLPEVVSLETVWFEDLGNGTTRLHAQSLLASFEARDGWLASGMETGVNDGYAKLDALLAAGEV